MLKSRKTKSALLASVLAGIIVAATKYFDIDKETVDSLLLTIGSVFGLNIAGIAYEDGQQKGNSNGKPQIIPVGDPSGDDK